MSAFFYMSIENKTPELVTDTLIERLIAEKNSGIEMQERKHEDWNDNYELYRNKVRTNRLTQRQAVNIPLMKETIKTMLSKIDEAPNIDWKERGGNEDKEIIYQEVWDANFRENKLELVDIIDKKNVLLYGIGIKKFNITDTGVSIEAVDVYDVLFDPLMNVGDIESARFVIHQNIFRSIQEILADDRYTKEGKDNLKIWLNSTEGITHSDNNKQEWLKRQDRLLAMGIEDSDFSLFAGGDRLINLTEHYTNVWNNKKKDWERRVIVYADNQVELLNETIMELIGVDFFPLTVWTEDPETTDIYSDSIADLVRTPNKVLNVWFSQLIENRTLKNFQMHWFSPTEGYTPQTYTPGPGVQLPSPPVPAGKSIRDVIMPVEVSGLDDTMAAIQALTTIVERGTGATSLEKGESGSGQQTLGEVEILVGKSAERAVGMSKFYRLSWYETAVKWNKLMHANKPKILKLYKTGRSGKIYSKKVYSSDWQSKDGYEPIVSSSSEQEQESVKSIQKFQFILQQFPNNQALKQIAQKRMLELVNLTPDELKQVEEAESTQDEIPVGQQGQEQGQLKPQGEDAGLVSEIQNNLSQLE